MEINSVPIVVSASSLRDAIDQFKDFANGWDLPLRQAVKNAVSDAKENGQTDEDLLDEIVWNFKSHAPQGWSLDSTTGQPWKRNYSFYPTNVLLDHLMLSTRHGARTDSADTEQNKKETNG
jgi:hypothetical protein